MKRTAHYQRRARGDTRPWSEIPSQYSSAREVDGKEARELAELEMARYNNVVEVRWHFEGSTQGHYVTREQAKATIVREKQLKELQQWRAAARSAAAALESFSQQVSTWYFRILSRTHATIPDEEMLGALRDLSQQGLDDWFDNSPLDIDKLHDLLVEGELQAPPRSLVERIFGTGAGLDDDIILAQAEDHTKWQPWIE